MAELRGTHYTIKDIHKAIEGYRNDLREYFDIPSDINIFKYIEGLLLQKKQHDKEIKELKEIDIVRK